VKQWEVYKLGEQTQFQKEKWNKVCTENQIHNEDVWSRLNLPTEAEV